jgi:hypothetical protein
MKTTRLFYSLGLILLATILSFTACKKRKAFNDEDGQSSIDNKNAMSENDAAIGDVNDIISSRDYLSGGRSSGTSGVMGVTGNACGMTLDSLDMNQGSVKLVYNGITCRNRTRTGTIKLTIIDYANGKRWKNAGCQLKVEYINYKITRASDGKSLELNGTQTITNETGGTWFELFFTNQPSLAHTIKGTGLDVTFEDGKTATYNINRRITYTLPGDVLTCTAEGIASLNGIDNLENYGITRNGFDFTSQVITPIVWNLECGPWAPVQGEVHIKVDEKDFTLKVTFSVDASGNPVASSANSCAYGWKVEWSHKKKTKKKVTGYY